MSRPLALKITTVLSMIRNNSTASCCLAGVSPGSRTVRTTCGARMNMATARTAAAAVHSVSTAPASRQAASRSPRARKPVKTGMKAEPSAPPAIRLKSNSGMRVAAKKASRSPDAPNVAPTRACRTSPSAALAT